MTSKQKVYNSLTKILFQERRTGYGDSVVIGGLDAFIERNLPMLTNVLPEGLGYYSELDVSERRKLAELITSKIKDDEKLNHFDSSGGDKSDDTHTSRTVFPTGGSVQLDSPIKALKGNLAERTLRKLEENMGIKTVGDLLFHFPNRHDDFSEICKINQLKPGFTQSVV